MKTNSTLLRADQAGVCALAAATQFSEAGIVSRTVLAAEGLRVTLFGFAAGQELTEHTSTSRALIQILNGSSEWVIDGQPRTVAAGEIIHLPPRVSHAVRAVEPFSMLLTLVRESAATPAPTA